MIEPTLVKLISMLFIVIFTSVFAVYFSQMLQTWRANWFEIVFIFVGELFILYLFGSYLIK